MEHIFTKLFTLLKKFNRQKPLAKLSNIDIKKQH